METSPSTSGRGETSIPVNTKFQRSAFLGLLVLLGFALRAGAASLPINILDAQYTNYLATSRWTFEDGDIVAVTDASRPATSPNPLSDSLYHPVSGLLEAEANADLFKIGVYTSAEGRDDPFRAAALAWVGSDLWFSPLVSGTTTVSVQFLGWHQFQYTWGGVNLFDVTSGNEVWNFWWEGDRQGTVPWVYTGGENPRGTATLALETDFVAGNTYKLSMYSGAISNPGDRQRILIELSGFDPIAVPEPTALSLAGLGALSLALVRRRR
jgi:hypothetical protein